MGSFTAAWMKRLATFQSPVPSSPRRTAALFAFIKLHRRSQVSPFRVGVRPHLPTSEFVCADELWTYSAGMFFCGDYKGHYSDWEASTELTHSDFFVSERH